MALSLFWLCWNDSPNDKKFISNDKQVTLFERKFERRRPLLHASAYYAPCRGDDPRVAVAENGVCRSWATHIHTVPQRAFDLVFHKLSENVSFVDLQQGEHGFSF